jgi:hypothetical protein
MTNAHNGGRRGRPFARGNSGRPRGARNLSTRLVQSLLDGERDALLRKAIDLAVAGDVDMLKFLLGHLLPRDRLVKFELPRISTPDDAADALAYVLRAVKDGVLSPSEGASLADLIEAIGNSLRSKALRNPASTFEDFCDDGVETNDHA